MAIRTWKGGSAAVAQIWKGTITTTTAGHTYIVTLTDLNQSSTTVVFTYTLVAGDTTTTIGAASFIAAWNNSTAALVSAITATQSAGQVILTADTAGAPFSAATSGTGTWSGTGNTTESNGPYDWNIPANWVENVVPVATNDVIIQSSNKILYSLDQSAVALGKITWSGFTGTTGAANLPLIVSVTAFLFNASGVAYVNIGSSAIATRITGTASGGTGTYGLYLTGSAISTLTNEGGTIGVAVGLGQTSTITTADNRSNGTMFLGVGTTLTTYNQTSGTGIVECAATTVSADTGTLTINGVGAITTLNNGNAIGGATVYPNSSGTITTLNAKGGTTDFTRSRTARTVTTLNLYNGAAVVRDPAILTVTTLTQSDASTITAD